MNDEVAGIESILGVRFTEQQREAVGASSHRLQKVVAGAGTGKTQVIVGRFLFLVIKRGLDPERILCVTFTDYAAGEMRGRLAHALKKANYTGAECSSVFTFHSFCNHLLRRFREEAELPEEFTVLSDGEQDLLLWGKVQEKILSQRLGFEFITVASFGNEYEKVIRLMEEARKSALSIDEFEKRARDAIKRESDDHHRRYRTELLELSLMVWRGYEEIKKETEAIDYDDLILKAIALLEEKDEIRSRVREFYQYILVDEYQDTDRTQQKLLKLVAQEGLKNVTVVGDVRQSIYTWRGAHPEILSSLAGDERRLDSNFRSFNEILLLGNRLINDGRRGSDTDDVIFPESRLRNPDRPPAAEKRIFTFFGKKEEQARFVAATVMKLKQEGVSLDEIAVLARGKEQLKGVEVALKKERVPYISLAKSIYDSDVVLDVAQWLRIFSGHLTKSALARVLARHPFQLTPPELALLSHLDENFSFEDVCKLKGSFSEKLGRLLPVAERIGRGKNMSIPALLKEAVCIVGVKDEEEVANFERIFEKAIQFQSSRQIYSPLEFAEYLERMHKRRANEPQSNPYVKYGKVKLLSMHAAKGLEFDVVLLFDVTEKNNKMPQIFLDFEGEDGDGVVVAHLPYDNTKHPSYEKLEERERKRIEDEERRLLHVAVTRARKSVYITAPKEDTGRRRFNPQMEAALESAAVTPFVENLSSEV
ncbi:MAG: ATP-dependent helicase [Planctomycetota bacterium]|nr:ATP-dependent helicase [Planctomycetota bacterium]